MQVVFAWVKCMRHFPQIRAAYGRWCVCASVYNWDTTSAICHLVDGTTIEMMKADDKITNRFQYFPTSFEFNNI